MRLAQEEPLLTAARPVLFLMGDHDKFCSPGELKAVAARMASPDVRLDLFEVTCPSCRGASFPFSGRTRRLKQAHLRVLYRAIFRAQPGALSEEGNTAASTVLSLP